MIPIKLEIQGLYSYREKQVIEFENLTAAGLFGIFGAVGSGKSSILEGILLALYASTERLADRGERTSMLNLQSDLLLINFEFKAGKNNSRTILARYTTKRNPKNAEELQTAEHTFYEKIGNDIVPITERAEELVGMKKEHFKQTIIIPQGKFKEFLDLKPAPRAEMMKELFGLERFDLGPKTATLMKILQNDKIRLETQLNALTAYSEELLATKQLRAKEGDLEARDATSKVSLAEKEFQKSEQTRTYHKQVLEYRKTKEILEEKSPEIEASRVLYREFTKAKTYLKPIYDKKEEAAKDFEKYTTGVIECERFKIRIEAEIRKLITEEDELKEKNNKRPEREGKIRDLKKILEIQRISQDLKDANLEVETLQPAISNQKKNLTVLTENLKTLDLELEKIPVLDNQHLAYLQTTERDWQKCENQLIKLQSEYQTLTQESQKIENEEKLIQARIPRESETIENWIDFHKKNQARLESDREKMIQKQGLSGHTHLLQDGESCPLCGSKEHPEPLNNDAQNNELQAKTNQITAAKEEMEQITEYAKKLSELKIHAQNHGKNIREKEIDLNTLTEDLSQLKKLALDHELHTIKDFQHRIQTIIQELETQKRVEKSIKSQRQEIDNQRQNIEKSEIFFNAATQKVNSLNTAIKVKKEEIKNLDFCQPFYSQSQEAIQKVILTVEKDILEAFENLEGKRKHIQERKVIQLQNKTDLKNYSEGKEETFNKLEKLNKEFDSLKIEHQFRDEAAMIEMFKNSIDAETVLREIGNFDKEFAIVNDRIEKLEAEKGVLEFQEEDFLLKKDILKTLKEDLITLQNEMSILTEEIKIDTSKLQEKTKLENDFGLLLSRETALKELESLFKGSGFVKYVSSIYLKELCNTANIRFMKLTKNSLSLEIDHDNAFWVIDYLNGGKKRLLKTLSGGQTFQASLCLALALAEKVKALNQNDQSFFFLDEGFGALDRNSLRVVFETLKSLRFENRIVGIISHVEELQQEIGVYAKVELDPDRGSIVHYSY